MPSDEQKIDTSSEAVEPEIYSLSRELAEHWQVQSATAKKNGDNGVAVQFAGMATVVTKLLFECKRLAQERDDRDVTIENLASDVVSLEQELAALREAVEKHEANNGYNALLQQGMMQLLKEAGVWPKSSDIIAAYDRYTADTEERLSKAPALGIKGE